MIKRIQIQNKKEVIIKQWKPKLFEGFTMIILAARRMGKSVMCKYLCLRKGGLLDKSDILICFSTGVNREAYNFIEDEFYFEGYRPEVIEDILKYQNELKKDFDKKLPKITIILDDVITFKTRFDETLSRVFFTGRHYNINLIYITQSWNTISPQFSRNCDYFIFFKFFLKNDKKKIVELIGQYAPEDKIEKALAKRKKYELFIFNLISEGENLEEKLFKFKVPEKFVNL